MEWNGETLQKVTRMLPLSGLQGCKNKPRDPEDFTLSGTGADGALWTDCTMMRREARRKKCTFGTLPGTHEQDGCFSDEKCKPAPRAWGAARGGGGRAAASSAYTKAATTPQAKSGASARRTQDDGEVPGFGHWAPAGHKDDDRWDKGRRGMKGAHRLAYRQEERRRPVMRAEMRHE